MNKENVDKIIDAADEFLYLWPPAPEQRDAKDQGWIHLSDLRKILMDNADGEIK